MSLPLATAAKAPMPCFSISSGPRASLFTCSCEEAISAARAASASGFTSFGGLLTRSRARLTQLVTRAARSAIGSSAFASAATRVSCAIFDFGSSCFQRAAVVVAEHRALDDRARLLLERHGQGRVEHPADVLGKPARLAGDGRGSSSEGVRVEQAGRAEAGGRHAPEGSAVDVDERGVAGLSPQLALLDEPGKQPVERAVDLGAGLRQALALEQRNGKDVRFELGWRDGLHCNLHRGAMLADSKRGMRRGRARADIRSDGLRRLSWTPARSAKPEPRLRRIAHGAHLRARRQAAGAQARRTPRSLRSSATASRSRGPSGTSRTR